ASGQWLVELSRDVSEISDKVSECRVAELAAHIRIEIRSQVRLVDIDTPLRAVAAMDPRHVVGQLIGIVAATLRQVYTVTNGGPSGDRIETIQTQIGDFDRWNTERRRCLRIGCRCEPVPACTKLI